MGGVWGGAWPGGLPQAPPRPGSPPAFTPGRVGPLQPRRGGQAGLPGTGAGLGGGASSLTRPSSPAPPAPPLPSVLTASRGPAAARELNNPGEGCPFLPLFPPNRLK